MSHVHWWLFALSFVVGMVLTFALTVRSGKRHVPVGTSAGESEPPTTKISSDIEPPTTKISSDVDPPTTKIPVAKASPTTKIPAAKRPPAKKTAAAKGAPAKKTPAAKGAPTRKIPVVAYASFGPGSARADAQGNGPSGWMVKGRSDTRLYYTPDDAAYDRTVAQVWFKDEKSAARALFTPWRRSSKK
jgi:uncharacterized membrane protein ArfC